MRALVHGQSQPPKQVFGSLALSHRAIAAPSRRAHPAMPRPHKVEDQDLQRMPQAGAEAHGCGCGTTAAGHFAHDLGHIAMHAAAAVTAQAKLGVGPAGDRYEQEADAVADQVMRMPDSPPPQAGGGACPLCRARQQGLPREALQTKQADAKDAAGMVAPPITHEVLRASGQALDRDTRAFFEPRFGLDFGQVRLHADARAARSARAVGALAYTVGRHIVFGETLQPRTPSGKALLAHELVHVVQQGAVPTHAMALRAPDDWSQAQAGQAAPGRGVDSAPRIRTAVTSPQLQRQAAADTGAEAVPNLANERCHPCRSNGQLVVCCYDSDKPLFDENCYEQLRKFMEGCKESKDECRRQAQCAYCSCLRQTRGEKWCQCTGIV